MDNGRNHDPSGKVSQAPAARCRRSRRREWLVGRVEELGFGAPIVFILVYAVCTALSLGPRELAVDGTRIRARRFVIATGSSAAMPPIPGLDGVPYFRNETVFDNTELPRHLIIIGGCPIGLEMAQAHRALGSRDARAQFLEALRSPARSEPVASAITI